MQVGRVLGSSIKGRVGSRVGSCGRKRRFVTIRGRVVSATVEVVVLEQGKVRVLYYSYVRY